MCIRSKKAECYQLRTRESKFFQFPDEILEFFVNFRDFRDILVLFGRDLARIAELRGETWHVVSLYLN